MSDGPVFVEKVDYEAAAKAMYDADDCYLDTWDSQPEDGVKAWYRQMTRYAIDAALVGVRELKEETRHSWITETDQRRFVTEWEKVEE